MNRENKRKTFEKGYYKTHACNDTFTCKVCGRVCTPQNAGRSGLWYLPDLPVSPQVPVQMLYVSKSSPLILAFMAFFYFNIKFKNSFIFHLPRC